MSFFSSGINSRCFLGVKTSLPPPFPATQLAKLTPGEVTPAQDAAVGFIDGGGGGGAVASSICCICCICGRLDGGLAAEAASPWSMSLPVRWGWRNNGLEYSEVTAPGFRKRGKREGGGW